MEAGARWQERSYPVIILGLGFLLRAGLIQVYPPIFGDDTVTRIVYHERILIAHTLPALQAIIFALSQVSMDPVLVRYAVAVIGAIAALGFYYLAVGLLGRSEGFAAALLFTTHPFVVGQSTVPYTEILMLAGLFFAFHFFFTGNWLGASLALGFASLSRYEAWAACAVLAGAYLWNRARRPVEWLKGAVLFGWAPLAWMIYTRGLSPAGTHVVDASISLERLVRYVYLGWISVKFTPVAVLLLAALGVWRIWKRPTPLDARVRLLLLFLALFLVAIPFSAHGAGQDPERLVTAREAHIPISAVMLLAGAGLPAERRFRLLLVAAGAVFGVIGAGRYVARESSAPATQLGYNLAVYLDNAVREGETALILVKPIDVDAIHTYLERFSRRHGEAGRRTALQVLERSADSPPDFQRVAGQSRVARKRLWTLTSPEILPSLHQAQVERGLPEWVVIWSNFEPGDAGEARLVEQARASGPPEATLRAGPLSAAVYRIRR